MSDTPGETREALLQRVRHALGRPTAPPPSPPVVDAGVARLTDVNADLVGQFTANATAVGMHVHTIAEADVARVVIELLQAHNARRIGTDVAAMAGSLQHAGLSVADWTTAAVQDQFDLDAGVTTVAAAIAETGSIICTSGPNRSRGLSLVPRVHIAIVRHADIVPDLLDLWPRLRDNSNTTLPSSIAIITGPSKTADIEGILVTGVHGPAHVDILLVP